RSRRRVDRRGSRGRRHAPAGAWFRRREGAAGAAGETPGNAGTGGAAARRACHRRAGIDPRARSCADVGGCPKEEEGQPGNQMMHHSERGRS
ncbi:hypothetical protein, partial [Paenibacillus sp. O199]|uniref:hypothetical protein n=1 Tax=Paenibacillus sp. O199 TaxID=1643925 RepID=UPI001374714D